MGIIYLQETKYSSKIVEKILLKLKYIFGLIRIENIDDKTIWTLPITEKSKLSTREILKIFRHLNRKLYKYDVINIVMSSQLYKINLLKNKLYSENVNILDGKILFGYLIYDVIEYISKSKNENLENMEISILANDNTDITIENIKLISDKIKRLNIITNNINQFEKIESYLYEKLGIMVKLSNNKKKGMLKTDIIINMDFPNEQINKYSIPYNCIIVNINGNIVITSKRFSGINVNSFKIEIPDEYKLQGFDDEIVYESLIYKLRGFENIRSTIKQDDVKIEKLVGNKGIIDKKEFIISV